MLAMVPSATLVGVQGQAISVEVHVSTGLPAFAIVGLPDASCREARDRVRAAILSSGLRWPQKRVTVNLAPTGLRKGGSALDLPIAIALLMADGQLSHPPGDQLGFIGELGLDGSLRPVPGTISMVGAVRAAEVVVPPQCAAEAALVAGAGVRCARSLAGVVAALRKGAWEAPPPAAVGAEPSPVKDMADVRGQPLGRLAMEVAAAGCHHVLMVGPPGAGKTMLAERLPGLLPALSRPASVEVTQIHSAAGLPLPAGSLIRRPPFRAPHHSSSVASLVGGGGAQMRPGELSCAHHGVLFLDELGEFPASVLDTLRQPLEDGHVLVCRARASVRFPARVLLVAAMNPCPCGEATGPGSCRCPDAARARYARRVSGPLLDRFDLRIFVDRPDVDELMAAATAGGLPGPAYQTGTGAESSAAIIERVLAARAAAAERGVPFNAMIPAGRLDEVAPLEPAAAAVLERRLRQGGLSARGLHRVRRVARTVADLAGRGGPVGAGDVYAALALRVPVFSPATSGRHAGSLQVGEGPR